MEYANQHCFAPLLFVEDTASGKLPWQELEIGKILEKAVAGDTIITSEISKLARSIRQVLQLLEMAASKSVAVHIVKSNLVMDGSNTIHHHSNYSWVCRTD